MDLGKIIVSVQNMNYQVLKQVWITKFQLIPFSSFINRWYKSVILILDELAFILYITFQDSFFTIIKLYSVKMGSGKDYKKN